ncbi:hypothetical protein H5410_003543 [Solanum commersonii]|uniref:Uncharacterized protein n=1 Tax=Solanum commersonii TaxID=4109 RepID=A0A9J6B5E3_SOLCO|nr:hypothetical protein H5410_003543 [Solanum commersonii]
MRGEGKILLGSISQCVHEYGLKFTQLSYYVLEMVANTWRRMSGKETMLTGGMDIARLMIHMQHAEDDDQKAMKDY